MYKKNYSMITTYVQKKNNFNTIFHKKTLYI